MDWLSSWCIIRSMLGIIQRVSVSLTVHHLKLSSSWTHLRSQHRCVLIYLVRSFLILTISMTVVLKNLLTREKFELLVSLRCVIRIHSATFLIKSTLWHWILVVLVVLGNVLLIQWFLVSSWAIIWHTLISSVLLLVLFLLLAWYFIFITFHILMVHTFSHSLYYDSYYRDAEVAKKVPKATIARLPPPLPYSALYVPPIKNLLYFN